MFKRCRELVRELSLEGHEETLTLNTLERTNSVSKLLVVSVGVFDRDNEHTIYIWKMYVKDILPISVDNLASSVDVCRWPHLVSVELLDVLNRHVDLFIEQDVPEALIPREVLSSDTECPYAVRTLLGWTLNGPLSLDTSVEFSSAAANFVQSDIELSNQ